MKKAILISEEQYNGMLDSYDNAMEELGRVKGQLQALQARGAAVKMLEPGEEQPSIAVLDGIFENYAASLGYSGLEKGQVYPEPLQSFLDWFNEHGDDLPEGIGDTLFDALAGFEKQWFVNGFRYAMGIYAVC